MASDALETQVVDEGAPVVLGGDVGVGARETTLAHRDEQLHQPVALQLDARRPVAERRGRVRAVREPEVREPGRREPQVRPGAGPPLVGQQRAAHPADRHLFEPARDRVEARRQRDHVQRVERAVRLLDPVPCEPRDRLRLHVHHVHVALVELLVEVLLETQPLGPEWVRRFMGCEERGFFCVVHSLAHSVPPEVVGVPVRRDFPRHVRVVVHQEPESTLCDWEVG